MSRFIVVLALALSWTASLPSSASVFSRETTERPDVPTTLAERAARAVYPGPVHWILGAPAAEEGSFVSFLKRLRSYFTADEPTSRPSVVEAIDRHGDLQASNALYRDWDAPLPVMAPARPARREIINIFLGVNLRFFLRRLFSTMLPLNDEPFADSREWASWRSIFFGVDATDESWPNGTLADADQIASRPLAVSENALTPIIQSYLPPNEEDGKPVDKNLLAEFREKILTIASHPLFLLGLTMIALFSFVRRLRGHPTAD